MMGDKFVEMTPLIKVQSETGEQLLDTFEFDRLTTVLQSAGGAVKAPKAPKTPKGPPRERSCSRRRSGRASTPGSCAPPSASSGLEQGEG